MLNLSTSPSQGIRLHYGNVLLPAGPELTVNGLEHLESSSATLPTGSYISCNFRYVEDSSTCPTAWTSESFALGISSGAIQTQINTWATGEEPLFQVVFDPKNHLRHQLKAQTIAPVPVNKTGSLVRALGSAADFNSVNPNELVALGLLKQMIPADQFRKYLKSGMLAVEGDSGLTYVLKRKSHFISILCRGKSIARLCVYLRDVPPTDDIVGKLVIIQCNELDIWKHANIRWFANKLAHRPTRSEITHTDLIAAAA